MYKKTCLRSMGAAVVLGALTLAGTAGSQEKPTETKPPPAWGHRINLRRYLEAGCTSNLHGHLPNNKKCGSLLDRPNPADRPEPLPPLSTWDQPPTCDLRSATTATIPGLRAATVASGSASPRGPRPACGPLIPGRQPRASFRPSPSSRPPRPKRAANGTISPPPGRLR